MKVFNNENFRDMKEMNNNDPEERGEDINMSNVSKKIISTRDKYLSEYSTNYSDSKHLMINENYLNEEFDEKSKDILKDLDYKYLYDEETNISEDVELVKKSEYSFEEEEKIRQNTRDYLKAQKFYMGKIENIKHKYVKDVLNSYDNSSSIVNNLIKLIIKATGKPWEILLDLFTPKSSEAIYLVIRFVVPLFFIWNFTEIELFLLERIMSRCQLPPAFLGLTIMSWGNNAPDMFNIASAMSRGMVDFSMNAAIASEMHNILLGLGLPWLVFNCTLGKPINFEMTGLYAFTMLFFAAFLLLFIVVFKMNKKRFDKRFAFFLIGVYCIFFPIIFCISFDVKF